MSMSSVIFGNVRWLLLSAVFVLLPQLGFAADFEATSFSEIDELRLKVIASHFLSRTTFGPTEPEVNELAARIKEIGVEPAFREWIDAQFDDYPISSNWETYEEDRGRIWPLAKKMLNDMGFRSRDFGKDRDEGGVQVDREEWKENAWWHRVLTSKDQLRQRMAWALSQIFVVGEGPAQFNNQGLDTSANPRWLGLAKYYDDVCIQHAFGNYRDLIDTVTYSPVMGVYLTSVKNRKADPGKGTFPDENYARELMQLFSIGLIELNSDGTAKLGPDGEPIETYDNETITALARVFTGLVYNNNRTSNDSFGAGLNLHRPMEMYEQQHDTGQKVAFGGRLLISSRRQSDTNARRDIRDVLDFLAYDHENTAPFICRRLIQRFVMSNPPSYYLRRVVKVWNDNKENDEQFKEVIKAILLDRTARMPLRFVRLPSPARGMKVLRRYPTEGTRLREPVLRYTALIRAFSPYPDPSFVTVGSRSPYYTPGGPEGTAGNQYFFIDNSSDNIGDSLGQGPFESDSVFNFYLPDYQPPGPISNYVPSRRVINGKLVSPEFQIVSPVTAVRTMNQARSMTTDSDFDVGGQWEAGRDRTLDIVLDFSRYSKDGGVLGKEGVEPTSAQLRKLLESLDLALCSGTMSESTKQTLLKVCEAETDRYNVASESQKQIMVRSIISVIMLAPDCAVMP